MSTIVRLDDGKFRLFVKGAPEFLLPLCKSELVNDKPEPLTQDRKVHALSVVARFDSCVQDALVKGVIEAYGERALRVILFAYRILDSEAECQQDEDTLVSNLTLHFFTGIQVCMMTVAGCVEMTLPKDPLRKEAQEAVSICSSAGVTVRMLTGDNVTTARAIAINCGILKANDDALVMEGVFSSPLLSSPPGYPMTLLRP